MSNLKGRSLVSITDYSKDDILRILDIAEEFLHHESQYT